MGPGGPDGRSARSSSWRSALSFQKTSGLYVWAALIVLFAIWVPDKFLTSTTWTTLASDNSVTTIVALGLVVALAAGVFDLSVGAVLGASAAMCAWLMVEEQWNPILAVVVTLLLGVLVGRGQRLRRRAAAGRLVHRHARHVVGRWSAFTEWLTDNQQIVGLPDSFKEIALLKPLGIPIPFFYMLFIAIVIWYVLQLTPVGRYLYATGGSREVARLAGVQPERWVFVSLVTSSFVASIGGVIVLARVSGAGPTLGAQLRPARVRRRLPRGHAVPARPLQRLGHGARRVPARRRGPRASSWPASSRGWTSCSTGRR